MSLYEAITVSVMEEAVVEQARSLPLPTKDAGLMTKPSITI